MPYSISEIIDMAIGIESSGYDFYTKAADSCDDEEAKETFNFLASQEKEHERIFSTMAMTEFSKTGMLNDEYYLYLKELGTVKVFFDADSFSEKKSVIEYAAEIEKNSILLYTELKAALNDAGEIEKLEKIIEEEKKHFAKLLLLKK